MGIKNKKTCTKITVFCNLIVSIFYLTQATLYIQNINSKSKKISYLNHLLVRWKTSNTKKLTTCLYDNYFKEKIIIKKKIRNCALDRLLFLSCILILTVQKKKISERGHKPINIRMYF